jgi:basic membrane protein A
MTRLSTRRKRWFIILGFLAGLGIAGGGPAGCDGRDSGTKLAREKSPRAAAFRVAMILPGPIHDRSWNQAGYEGLLEIEKKLGVGVAYTAEVGETEADTHFRDYARQGFDFIIGLGGEYVDAAAKVADEYPRTQFAVVANYSGNNRNLGALSFRFGEIDYLSGVTAGLKTRSGHIALIAGTPLLGVTIHSVINNAV